MAPIPESGSRQLTRALASRAAQLRAISTSKGNTDRELMKVYNALCVVLDYLNDELKREPPIEGAGPIPKTW